MSEQTNESTAAPAAPNSSEPFIERAWADFEKSDSQASNGAQQTQPSSSSPNGASNTPTPAASTPAASEQAPASRKVKYEFNHAEEEFDVDDAIRQLNDWHKDPAKPPTFKEILQKGRAFDKATERKYVDGQKAIAAHLTKLGVSIRQKTDKPQTFDDFEFTFPQAAMPQGTGADDPLAKQIAALEAKAKDGTATAEDLVTLPRLERQRDAQQAKAEADRQAQEAQRTRQQAETESRVDEALIGAIEARAKSFEGVEKEVADKVRSVVWALARENALKNGGDADSAKAGATAIMNHIESYVMARIKHLTATATPPASPVIGGSPTGTSAQAASKGRASMQNADWLDAALSEAETAGAARRR